MDSVTDNVRRTAMSILLSVAIFAPGGRVYAATHEPKSNDRSDSVAPTDGREPEIHGIKLGDFKIRSDYPAEAQKSTVRFVLFAAVKGDHFAAMEEIVDEHREKLRDEVITATRLTPLGVYQEPDLKRFRRRIFVRLHRTVPELMIDDLYISDFGLLVKSL